MSTKTKAILDEIKSLNCQERLELVQRIEDLFGFVLTPSPYSFSSRRLSKASKTVDVVLEVIPNSQKIAAIRTLHQLTGLNVWEVKKRLDFLPSTIERDVSWDIGKEIQTQLNALGAVVWLK